jgi:hypothetical protein
MGRDNTYRAIKAGTFPTPVLKLGHRMVVVRAVLLEALGIEDEPARTRPRLSVARSSAA